MDRQYKILVIDDDSMTQDVMRHFLESQNYIVKCVFGGHSAEIELKKESYDVIILDYNMPGMCGGEVFQRIRKNNPSQMVILVTGNLSDEAFESVIGCEKPANALIYKPFKCAKLIETVRCVLNGEQRYETPAHKRNGDDIILR